jgi:hypothetical protein
MNSAQNDPKWSCHRPTGSFDTRSTLCPTIAGIGPVHGAGESDLVLPNVNTGQFEVYDIANNQLTGAAPLGTVGLDWQLGGFAVDPPTNNASVGQLVQAMAGFGGSGAGGVEDLNGWQTDHRPKIET